MHTSNITDNTQKYNVIVCECRNNWSHHATIKVLVQLEEGVWRSLAFACDDHTNVGNGQRVAMLDGRCTSERDEDAL